MAYSISLLLWQCLRSILSALTDCKLVRVGLCGEDGLIFDIKENGMRVTLYKSLGTFLQPSRGGEWFLCEKRALLRAFDRVVAAHQFCAGEDVSMSIVKPISNVLVINNRELVELISCNYDDDSDDDDDDIPIEFGLCHVVVDSALVCSKFEEYMPSFRLESPPISEDGGPRLVFDNVDVLPVRSRKVIENDTIYYSWISNSLPWHSLLSHVSKTYCGGHSMKIKFESQTFFIRVDKKEARVTNFSMLLNDGSSYVDIRIQNNYDVPPTPPPKITKKATTRKKKRLR